MHAVGHTSRVRGDYSSGGCMHAVGHTSSRYLPESDRRHTLRGGENQVRQQCHVTEAGDKAYHVPPAVLPAYRDATEPDRRTLYDI